MTFITFQSGNVIHAVSLTCIGLIVILLSEQTYLLYTLKTWSRNAIYSTFGRSLTSRVLWGFFGKKQVNQCVILKFTLLSQTGFIEWLLWFDINNLFVNKVFRALRFVQYTSLIIFDFSWNYKILIIRHPIRHKNKPKFDY